MRHMGYERPAKKADRQREPWQETVTFKAPKLIRDQLRELVDASGASKSAIIKAAIASHYEQTLGGI